MKSKLCFILFLFLLGLASCPSLAQETLLPAQIDPRSLMIKTLLEQKEPIFKDYIVPRSELIRLYMGRGYTPAWEDNRKENRQALNDFMNSVQAFAAYHGLWIKNYPIQKLHELIESDQEGSSEKLEILMTSWLMQIAHDLQGDHLELSRLYEGWTLAREKKDIPLELGKAIKANKVQAFFDNLSPHTLTYVRLASTLKAYRQMHKDYGAWPQIEMGPSIRPGTFDNRVSLIRRRLAEEHYIFPQTIQPDMENFYGQDLKRVIIAYQARNGLEADGIIGPTTIENLNQPIETKLMKLRANMERLRHMPDSFEKSHVYVNIPDASIKVFDEGQLVYHAIVVVGSETRRTPFIQSKIRSIIFNPTWHVPDSIAKKDILPKLKEDPHYLEKMGYVINGSADDPHGETIDWSTIEKSDFNFRLRQSPGDLNGLGRVKFDFDNDFAVFLHDTAHPELFSRAERYLSSGCIRIKDPALLAHLILSHNKYNWPLPAVEHTIEKGKTRWLKVERPLPVYILYDTAFFPTGDSLVHFRKDIYGYDAKLMKKLNKNKS